MAFQYLWYEELDEAMAQSRGKLVEKMGHAKPPGQITEYKWGWMWPPDQSYYLLQIPETDFEWLSPAEMRDLLPESDPLVQACYSAPGPGG